MRTVGSRRHVYQFPLLRFILRTKYEDQVAALLRTLYSSLSLRLSGLLPVYALRRAGRSPGAGGLDLYLGVSSGELQDNIFLQYLCLMYVPQNVTSLETESFKRQLGLKRGFLGYTLIHLD